MAEGHDTLDKINKTIVNDKGRPYQNIRIKHTVILDDPFPDPKGLKEPSRSPSPVVIRKVNGNGDGVSYDLDHLDDEVDLQTMMKNKTDQEIQEEIKEHQSKTRAAVLEILEDLPDADIEPPKNVLFVCKLNPVTQ